MKRNFFSVSCSYGVVVMMISMKKKDMIIQLVLCAGQSNNFEQYLI